MQVCRELLMESVQKKRKRKTKELLLFLANLIVGLVILLPLLYAVKKEISILGISERHANKKSLLLIVLAVIIIIISAGNVSWLTPGVIK